jgi:hypothetical protein
MNYFSRLSLLGSGLGLFLVAVSPSFATVIGTLSSAQVGAPTNLIYAVTPLMTAQPIGGAKITPATVSGMSLTVPDTPDLGVTLDSFSSPLPSAAPMAISPVVLTASSVGADTVEGLAGGATYGTVVSNVVGSFNVTSTETREELTVVPTYNTPYSGPFVSTVPEPRSISLVLLAGLLIGLVLNRRKSEALKNEA